MKNYGLITSIEELGDFARRLHASDVFAYDIETGYDGPPIAKGSIRPETAKVVGISFTTSTDWARYVPLGHDEGENLDNRDAARLFWPLLSSGKGVAHNAVFELRHLSRWFRTHLADDPDYGEQVRATDGYYPIRSDTMVEAYLAADLQYFGLKYLTRVMFDLRGDLVPQPQWLARAKRLVEIAAIKDLDERAAADNAFDGHRMTELYQLFPDLPANKRKFLRFNSLELTPKVVEYACEDSVWCLAIHRHYFPQLNDQMLYKVERAIVQDVVPAMEDFGVAYDWALMRRTAEELRTFRDKFNAEIMDELSAMLGEQVAVNLASPAQVSEVLFTKLGYATSVYTDKTRNLDPDQRKMSTGKIALERLAKDKPVVQQIRQWKGMTRLLGTYLEKYEGLYNFAEDGRAHPGYLSAFVVTGRFAAVDPPIQQSPKEYHYDLKEAAALHQAHRDAHGKDARGKWCSCADPAFEPPPGTCFRFNFRDVIMAPPQHYILGFDLSQAELRAIAGEAQEPALLEAFANGVDVHVKTASVMLGIAVDEVTKDQRDFGKMLNFAMGYGMQVKGLADRMGIAIDEAQSLMDKYFAGLPSIVAWSQRQVQHGKKHGYVTSKFGRKLPIWEYHSDVRWIYQKGDRACVNYPIQGAATGDYMKIAMVRAVAAIKDAGLRDKIRLFMNVHDALEFYVHQSVQPHEAIAVLRPAVVFPVPGWPAMKADWHIAKRWGSPTQLDVHEDGSIFSGGRRIDESPGLSEDEDGELVYELPEVDPQLLRQLVQPHPGTADPSVAESAPGRQLIVTLTQMPTPEGWEKFLQLLRDTPGDNTVRLVTPEGEALLAGTTGLGTDDVARVWVLLGEVTLTHPSADVDAAAITAGLTL